MSEQTIFGDLAVRYPNLVQQVISKYRQLNTLLVRAHAEAFG